MIDNKIVNKLVSFLLYNSSDTAFVRMEADAREQKQSIEEIARRRAVNILNSYTMHRDSDCYSFEIVENEEDCPF